MAGFKNKNIDKNDSVITDGLLGVSNSLAYRVHEIEKHFHSYERWFETATTPSGETYTLLVSCLINNDWLTKEVTIGFAA